MASKNPMLFYNTIADEFDSVVNYYDTLRRLEVVNEDLLPEDIANKKVLDAGCGTGWFAGAANKRKANVTAMDIGPDLLQKVSKKYPNISTVEGSVMNMPFSDNSFDIVISSEVIEHVENPEKAIAEISRVLKPNGIAIITTPNIFWKWTLIFANALKIRPYQGLENWSSLQGLKESCVKHSLIIEKVRGVHLFPFVIQELTPLLRLVDNLYPLLNPFMLNLCLRLRKADEKY